jgi:2-amino-4-hydroxy-6-hydroxymethyldihydropteridine diphosphokinase
MIKEKIFLLLGTNLGDRFDNLISAKNEIEKKVGNILLKSNIYETAAWGITDQPSFLNQVLQVSTRYKPEKVLETILNIELDLGRKRIQKWGARLIDIDILYFGNEKIKQENLVIPHPFLQDRRFTLVPLVEIAPDFEHPIFKKTNSELLEICGDDSNVTLLTN